MGRLIVVVAVLLAIAFLANKYLLHDGDPRPADDKAPAAAKEDAAAGEKDDASDKGANASTPVTDAAATQIDAEAAAAAAAPAATVDTDIAPAAADSGVGAAAADVTREELNDAEPGEEIDAADPARKAGIAAEHAIETAEPESAAK